MKKLAYGIVLAAAVALGAASVYAADADVTGLVPSLCMTFDNQSLANTGTGTATWSNEGTATWPMTPRGYAIDTSKYVPYATYSGVFTANHASSIAVVATLSEKSTAIMVHFKYSTTELLLRRGTTPGSLVLTRDSSTTPVITVNNIEDGDTEYHLYVVNIKSDGTDLYVDGELKGTTSSTPYAAPFNNGQLGSRHGGAKSGESKFGGLIDDFRVYPDVLTTDQMVALGKSLGVNYVSGFSILPIPAQLCLPDTLPEPGFTLTNIQSGASWIFAEGGVAPAGCPFEVSYGRVGDVGAVTVTGKAGEGYEGVTVIRNYAVSGELLVNGGFESGNWAPGWTASGNYAKIDTSSSAYGPNVTTTFISGSYCAILQKRNVATQVFTNDSPYGVEVSWKCKQRGGYSGVPYEVTIDGNRIFYEDFPTSTSEVHYRTVEDVVLPPGEHTLKFETFATADRTLFLDDVSLKIVSKRYVAALPIPDQVCGFVGGCRPEFTVSNVVNAQTWTIGGDIVSADFDVAYSNNADPGVATVTVTGKGNLSDNVFTTTFNVYRRVKSITSTGTQYIDTGIVPGPTTAVEMHFCATNNAANTSFFGAGIYNQGNSYCLFQNGMYYFIGKNGTSLRYPYEAGVDNVISINTNAADNCYLNVGGNTATSTISLAYNGSYNLHIFASGGGGQKAKFTLYSFKMWKDGELVRDFVPVRGNAVGLWDFVTSTFFKNAGTGAFIAGPDETDIAVARIPNQFYSGAALEPSVVVSNLAGTALLVKGVDYTVAYEDNDAVGTGKAIVTGLGAYRSVVTNEFAIYAVPAASAFTSGSYVQHGLMNHWDAIDNVGTGTFDPAATTWKDLKGNLDFTLTDRADWGGGFLETHGCAGIANDKTGKYLTMEIKYRSTNSRLGMPFFSGYGWNRVAWYRSSNQLWFHHANNETRNILTGLDAAGTTYDFSVVYGAGGGGSDAPMLFYEGGVPHTTGISNQKYQTAELNWITSFTRASIGGGSESQYNYEGRLYSIRLYDCPLSAREIAYNAAVDKVRFDGVAPAEAFNAPDMRWNATSGKVEVFIDLSTLHGDGTLSINGGGASAWVSVGDEVSIVYAPATGEKALEWFGLPDGAPRSADLFTVNFTAEAPVAAKLQMLKKIDIARALNADPGIEEGSGSFNDGANRTFMPVSWNRTHSGAGLGTYSTTSDERGWHYLSPYQGPAFFQEGLALPAGNYTLTFDHAANNTDHTIYSWQLVDTNNAVQSICNVTNEMRIYGTSWHTVQADFTVAEGGIYKLQTVKIAVGAHGNCYSLFDNVSITSDTDLHIEVEKCYPYFGEAQVRPPVVVRDDDGNVLTEGVDYELLYGANNSPGVNLYNAVALRHGNGYVAAKGIGTHYGVAGANFRIGTPIYVKPDGLPSNGGTSWADAVDFATALNLAAATNINHEIWIAGSNVLASAATEKLFYGNKIFRGGFKGTESTIEEREPGSYSVIDGDGQFSAVVFRISCNAHFERLHFRGSPARAVSKTGWTGDVFVDDCVFEENGNALYVRGLDKTPYDEGSVYVKDSIFKNNSSTDAADGAAAIYSYQTRRVSVENTLFYGNTLATSSKVKTSAIYANSAAVELKECDFIGNIGSGVTYGTVRASGINALNKVENCLFRGNQTDGANGAAVMIEHSSDAGRTEIANCTFTANANATAGGCAGVKGVKGQIAVRNSIFFGNGVDFADGANASFDIDYTLLADDTGATYSFVNGVSKLGDAMTYGDPLFVAVDDCHLLSEAGYFDSEGDIHYAEAGVRSPAIDAGDPESDFSRESAPNGGCVNLGRYGNTEQASRTPSASPEVVGAPTITWDDPDGYTMPTVSFTMGGSGTYAAHGVVYISTDGGTTWEDVSGAIGGVVNGQTKTFLVPVYYIPGDTIQVKVVVSGAGQTSESTVASSDVLGTLPPWWGKKGPDNVIHLRPGAIGSKNDGTSWSDAFTSWADALAALTELRNEIWIAGDIALNASPATFAFAVPTVIRGGFTGAETLPGERIAGAKSTLDGQATYTVLPFSNAAGVPVVLDGLRIFNGVRGIVKTGAGDLSILNCEIVGNHTSSASQNGIGLSLTGTTDAKLVISNSVVSGNYGTATSVGNGQGLYVSTFGSVLITDTIFLTNGLAWTAANLWNEGRDGQAGAALYINNAAATVKGCTFRGNRGSGYDNRGGIVRVAGTSGGTLFDHCVFAGNEEDYHWRDETAIPVGGSNGGQIAINLAAETDRVTISNCTLACNFSDNSKSAAGVTVAKGTAVIKNSIIANNIVHSSNSGGADLALMADVAHAEVSYSLLSADGPSSYSSVVDGTLLFGSGVRFGNPELVSSTNDVSDLLVIISNARKLRQFDKTKLDEVLGIDVHALSSTGYFTNDGVEHVSGETNSPAIDAGDPLDPVGSEPTPNGGIVNAGAYGGTAQASKSAAGEPAVDGPVTITFDEEYSRPTVHFTVGGEGAFFATANVLVSTDGSSWMLMNTLSGLANGTVVDCPINAYYEPGSIWAKVILSANGTVAEATSVETPVTKDLPPWWGKGGPANVIHVRPGAIGAGTGENWSDAVPNLRSAFSLVSASKNEIWIAGTNVLTVGSVTLNAANPLSVKGGFHGWENSAAEREPGFRSVIDGDDKTDCLTIANSASVSIERIYFTRSLNCGLIKTGAGDMLVSDCHFITNGMGRATDPSGKGARVSGTAATTVVTFTNCVFRGNRVKTGMDGGVAPLGGGINASSLKSLRIENCYFVHNGIYLRAPGGANSGDPSTGNCSGSAVYSSAPVSAVGCRFAANFGTVRYSAGHGGTVRLVSGAEGSAFTNCAWVANGDEVVWKDYSAGNNASGPLVVQFGSASGTVDVERCTFAYNLADGYETTAGLNLILGTANVHNSIFFGNILGGLSSTRGSDISLRGASVCNVSYTLFGEEGTNSITSAATATTNFLGGVVFGDPLLVTESVAITNLVKKSGNLIFWDWTAATIDATYAALENVNVHLRGGRGYFDEKTGELVDEYCRAGQSPAIDAGDPASDFRNEPNCKIGYHGKRVNLGGYGNTPWATMTTKPGFFILLR